MTWGVYNPHEVKLNRRQSDPVLGLRPLSIGVILFCVNVRVRNRPTTEPLASFSGALFGALDFVQQL